METQETVLCDTLGISQTSMEFTIGIWEIPRAPHDHVTSQDIVALRNAIPLRAVVGIQGLEAGDCLPKGAI